MAWFKTGDKPFPDPMLALCMEAYLRHPACLHFMWFTVYPKKYAHGFVVLCFVVVMQSFLMNSYKVFIHIHQGCFAGTGAIVRLPQCQWSKPDGYGKISQCITTTKHSKAKTVCIFLWIYCSIYWTRATISGRFEYCRVTDYLSFFYVLIFFLLSHYFLIPHFLIIPPINSFFMNAKQMCLNSWETYEQIYLDMLNICLYFNFQQLKIRLIGVWCLFNSYFFTRHEHQFFFFRLMHLILHRYLIQTQTQTQTKSIQHK